MLQADAQEFIRSLPTGKSMAATSKLKEARLRRIRRREAGETPPYDKYQKQLKHDMTGMVIQDTVIVLLQASIGSPQSFR